MDSTTKNKEEIKKKFIMASEIERQNLKLFAENNEGFNLLKTTELHHPFDGFANSGDCHCNWAVEVKIRSFKLNKYPTAFLRKEKYDRMMTRIQNENYQNKNVQPILLNFFTCGAVALWNLNNITMPEPITVRYKRYNVVDSDVIDNIVYELPIKQANIYRWK